MTTPIARGAASLLLLVGVGVGAAHAQFLEPDATILHQFDGPAPGVGASYGWAVADIGDLDADGVRDSIIGEPFDPAINFAGRTQVRSSRTGAILLDLVGGPGATLGHAIAEAGDVNADGTPDIVSGGPYFGGRALVYSGADGAILLDIPPVAAGVFFGYAVAGAGDVNQDGLDDVLVSAPFAGASSEGAAYVISGADASVLRTYTGVPGALLGTGAANAGDIDGDGRDDHILGAAGAATAYLYSGATGALIHELPSPSATPGAYGDFFVAGLSDTNLDAVRDLYVGDYADDSDPNDTLPGEGKAFVFSGADGSLLQQFSGADGDRGMGPGRGAGDHDNDGCEDLAVGNYVSSLGALGAGKVTIFSGYDGAVLKTYTYTVQSANLGFDCVGLGDVDGDGSLDLLGSAASADTVFILAGDPRPCPADVNRDARVNVLDFIALLRAFDDYNRYADLDHDAEIDIFDVALWLRAKHECRRH